MEDITSFQQPASLFQTSYSLAIRLWHWLTFIILTTSIVMVLLASTVFAMHGNIPMVQEQVHQKGGNVTSDQARSVAHEYNDKLWNLHKYLGYGLSFLLLCRILIELSYSKDRKLATKIKNAVAFRTNNQVQSADRRHYIWVKWGYVIFYLLFSVMVITGLVMAFEDVPFFRSIREPVTAIHKIDQFLIYAYILFHIAGVIRADLTDNSGIVSKMINGGKHEKQIER